MPLVINIGFQKKEVDKYQYRDLSLPLVHNYSGNIAEIGDVESIKNGIRNIMTWRQGWRVLNPGFGNMLHKYVGEPCNNSTARRIQDEILSMIPKWEPRIRIGNVSVVARPDDYQFDVEINYSIPTLQRSDSVTYTIQSGT